LVEVVIVLGIMLLILSMGLPSMVRVLEKAPLRQAVSDVEEGLHDARAQAILQGRVTEFVITADGEVVVRWVERPAEENLEVPGEGGWGDPVAEEGGLELAKRGIFRASLGADVGIMLLRINGGLDLVSATDAEEGRVRFYPNGTSDDMELDLQDATGGRKIVLDPITGFAEVEVLR
jgi:type II secretory pathway pseudopilin PulG